jgi:dTDP-4-dehydrorhamnose 3,5-epimerase
LRETILIDGIRIIECQKNLDERGYFAELIRQDAREFLGEDQISQINLAYSYPGIIRAWHRHNRGQNDYFICLAGSIKVCAFDDRNASPTNGELDEIVLNGKERLQIARILGKCWHGYKVVSSEPALIVYGVSRLYDPKGPDEERRDWNDKTLLPMSLNGRKDDSRLGKPYDWNHPPHK